MPYTASEMAHKRWAGVSDEDKSEYGKMMARARKKKARARKAKAKKKAA